MTCHRFVAFAVVLVLLVSARQANSTVLVSDDFSAADSGSGWAAGNSWEGLDVGNGYATTAGGVESFRDFDPPIDAHNQVTYIRFDYRQEMPGDGNAWGGTAFFEGVEGDPQEEAFFGGGNAGSGPANYASDLKQGDLLDSGVAFDDQWHTIIAKIDTTAGGGNATYAIWVDSLDVGSPNSEATIANSPIDASWGTLRLASDPQVVENFDNLTIATSSGEVGLIPEPASSSLLVLVLVAGSAACRRRSRRLG